MTKLEENEILKPGQKAPASGIYECCGPTSCGHRFSTDVAGHRLPPLPADCKGGGWRLQQPTPHIHAAEG
ncbi:hypothetical protein [Nocardia bhagyanarayanae]|uniref:Uncharacterized protein n=1 Tax=Nocardia bhagyanarayanae TaxID=1215925 RepID=A0A543FEZ4_9NOCA|nr:hypothetical protein [Nocardia bhagyanarayanae]TQM32438.1 hypothetical protein FB390_4117 [Nocardia bhagyanarayanae]